MGNTDTNAGRPRALVADDDAGFLMLMEQVLSEAGFNTACVSNGAQAIERVVEFEPHLIFLDNLMPQVSGLEACVALRDRLGPSCPPIVVVTSGESNDDITEAFSAGASDYLVKPVNWHLFKYRLSGWLSQVENGHGLAVASNSLTDKLLVARNGDLIEVCQHRSAGSLVKATDVPNSLWDFLPDTICEQITASIARVLKTRGTDSCRFNLMQDGQSVAYDTTISAKGADKAVVELRPVPRDVVTKNELFRLAYIDPVTGVPNRHLFDVSAKDRMERAKFRSGSLTFLCLTFDRVADAQPDQPHIKNLLAAAAESLINNLRDSDHLVRFDVPDASSPPLASLDGVHFLILLDHAKNDDVVDNIVERIQRTCEDVDVGDGDQVKLVPRVGISCFPDDGENLDQLIDAAVLATREARQLRQDVRRFGNNSNAPGNVQVDLENELMHALESGQLSLYYQPRIDLQSGRVMAAEALIRWQHPFRGIVPVKEIFDVAASAGKVASLTDWAFREACSEAATWNSMPHPVKVSINLSEEQLIRPNFADSVIAILEDLQINPAGIEIEMRESLLDCTDRSLRQLQQLSDVGVGIIVDDFGSDRTSLVTLRRLRIDGFKVNHDLARAGSLAGQHSGVYTIANAIAQARNAVLIAKGIESADELALVRSRRCHQAQGFHICQPLPAEEFRQYLEETKQSGTALLEIANAI
jgi:EAL domain-containing protein (putative c-di-GMP-specific phosphodiesterase class I)/PleD family two-component response regulator